MSIVEQKSERIAARVTPDQKALLIAAANMRGRSLTEFVIETAQQEARDIMNEERLIRLSIENQQRLVEALLNPPRPNAALISAARAYDEKGVISR